MPFGKHCHQSATSAKGIRQAFRCSLVPTDEGAELGGNH